MLSQLPNGNIRIEMHKYEFYNGAQLWALPGLKVVILYSQSNGQGYEASRSIGAQLLWEHHKRNLVRRIPND